MGKLFALVVALIVYGSLFPFNFHQEILDGRSVAALLHTWSRNTGHWDQYGNLLLFLPFGYTAMLASERSGRTPIRIAGTLAAALALSVALQLAQIYLPGRDSTLSDTRWNLIGAALGCAIAAVPWLRLHPSTMPVRRTARAPVLLLACWLGYLLVPFAPSLDWHDILRRLQPLYRNWTVEWWDLFGDVASWLIVARLWQHVCDDARRERWLLPMVPLVLLVLPVILYRAFSASAYLAAAAALALWWGGVRRFEHRDALLGISLGAALLVNELSPFRTQAPPSPFHWLPFYGLLYGSMAINTAALFHKLFLYGTWVWLWRRAGVPLFLVAATGVALTGAIEIMQMYVPGHVAELTDPLLLALLAFGSRVDDAGLAQARPHGTAAAMLRSGSGGRE